MKSIIKFILITLLFFGYTSCDEVDKLSEVDFNTTINENLFVTVPAGEDQVLNKTMIINMINSDTEDYMDVLESVKITEFTYQLVNFTGDPNGTILGDFYADGVELMGHSGIVKQVVDAGTIFEVNDVAILNSIASKLKNGNNVSIGVAGTSSCEEEMNFTIAITIELEVTADAL